MRGWNLGVEIRGHRQALRGEGQSQRADADRDDEQ
jgi:hypothetical protein